jgi:alpha-galactosidase
LVAGSAVEVPVLVDANGLQPTVVDDIPPQLLALMRTNQNVQEMTVQALLNEDREHIYHAAMLDPHTAAELDLDQIRAMVDALIDAHGTWLPAWAQNRKAA